VEHDTVSVTLVFLVEEYIKNRDLPYIVVPSAITQIPEAGIRPKASIPFRSRDEAYYTNDWLGWIYETEFKTFNWGMNAESGVIKQISAHDPEFFVKLEAWLPECDEMWRKETEALLKGKAEALLKGKAEALLKGKQ
jgi:hypothetical protein